MSIPQKTRADLEFPVVLQHLEARCATELGALQAAQIAPITDTSHLMEVLGKANEYLASFSNENKIPNHGFDAITEEFQLLGIANTCLEAGSFRKILHICKTGESHIKFFKKFKTYYPLWFETTSGLPDTKEIRKAIQEIIDRFGEIKDSASPELASIRQKLLSVRSALNKSFASALSRYKGLDYLDEIHESVMDNKRVLAVKAMYRRKVKGSALGASKTGSIVFIEPDAVLKHSRELNNLLFDEQEEIRRILLALTDFIRPDIAQVKAIQDYLTDMDVCCAKAKYARELNAILPEFNQDRHLYLRDAYHPLLFLTNQKKKEKTWPQTISLGPENRIMVISGPNAGGKSITLKTIGLLQVMLQSGILIPVHERSSICLFDTILTDIGDNQSIENHLSTYSYRLTNMRGFLRKCNATTLFLIDEFGTGSDPELGGALAEAFLEEFYEKGSYGVITTHYTNLKVLADELPHATNANMLFNAKTLQPTFQLETGQPGSSFTFEVAQQIGIPFRLINRAKKKIERGKVRFDATIAKLQKERNKMVKTGSQMEKEEARARDEADRMHVLNAKLKSKLESYQELYDYNQRMILLGGKLDKAAEKYYRQKKKRQLISELLQIVETENSKRAKKKKPGTPEKRSIDKKKVAAEMEKEIQHVRKEKARKKKAPKPKPKPVYDFQVGDHVRLIDGKAVGSIDSLEKNKAVVNYGRFTTNVSIDQLELVRSKK